MSRSKPKTRSQSIAELRRVHSESSRIAAQVAFVKPVVSVPLDPKKDKKLATLLDNLKKKYKDDVVTTIAGGSRADNISVVKTGWSAMDDLVTGETDNDGRTVAGSGLGWPRGRIVEVFGEEGVGKTTMTLHMIKAFQQAGERAAFVDAEHALDVSYARKIGVDLTTLLISQPDAGGEQALDIIQALSSSGSLGIIVVDSVAALTPLAELEQDFEDNVQPGSHARLMSRALRKLISIVAKNDVLLVFINQTRMKIGVRFGNPKTTTGGQALKFYASIRFELTNMKTVKKGDRVLHRRTRVRTLKNKVAPPFREVFMDVTPSKGITAVHGDPGFGGGDGD